MAQQSSSLRSKVNARLGCLLKQHEEMEHLFSSHQEALVERDWEAARRELDGYRALVEAHITEEETDLLPIYATLGEAPRGGSAELLRTEHQKILKGLARLDMLMTDFEALATVRPRDMIELLERESTFKHLMEHHDIRERRFFFPVLEAWSS